MVTTSASLMAFLLSADSEVPVQVTFRHRSDDAPAVYMDFDVHQEKPVTWVFARELLSSGACLSEISGIGDVKVGSTGDLVYISLESPFGAACVKLDAQEVSEFLLRSYDAVPEQAEHELPGIDLEIAKLLEGGA